MPKMWTVNNVLFSLFLICCGVIDIKKQCVPIWLMLVGTVATIAMRIVGTEVPLMLWLLGVALGIIFLGISKGTGEALGYGDSWLILLLGIYLGLWQALYLLCIAFFICGIFAMVCMIRKKAVKNMSIPFMPFLVLGFWGVMII